MYNYFGDVQVFSNFVSMLIISVIEYSEVMCGDFEFVSFGQSMNGFVYGFIGNFNEVYGGFFGSDVLFCLLVNFLSYNREFFVDNFDIKSLIF